MTKLTIDSSKLWFKMLSNGNPYQGSNLYLISSYADARTTNFIRTKYFMLVCFFIIFYDS